MELSRAVPVLVGEAYYRSGEDLPTEGPGLLRARAEQMARVMRERRDRMRLPGTSAGRAEALREDSDLLWATLRHFLLIWAPLSFTALLEQEVLEGSLLDEPNLQRWIEANMQLQKEGIYR